MATFTFTLTVCYGCPGEATVTAQLSVPTASPVGFNVSVTGTGVAPVVPDGGLMLR